MCVINISLTQEKAAIKSLREIRSQKRRKVESQTRLQQNRERISYLKDELNKIKNHEATITEESNDDYNLMNYIRESERGAKEESRIDSVEVEKKGSIAESEGEGHLQNSQQSEGNLYMLNWFAIKN